MLKTGDHIKVHMMDVMHNKEIRTRNFDKVFEIVPDMYGAPGIWWYGEDGGLSLLVSFAWSVFFEDVKTGILYHPDAFTGEIVPADKKRYKNLLAGLSC